MHTAAWVWGPGELWAQRREPLGLQAWLWVSKSLGLEVKGVWRDGAAISPRRFPVCSACNFHSYLAFSSSVSWWWMFCLVYFEAGLGARMLALCPVSHSW